MILPQSTEKSAAFAFPVNTDNIPQMEDFWIALGTIHC